MTLILLLPLSLLLLYRSYFVLFPIERSSGWNFGYDKLADYIRVNADKNYMVDNSRNPRNYILLLYFLDYPTNVYQKEVDDRYKINYYRSLPPEDSYKFSNISVRTIDWKIDSYKDQIIIGDPLSISDQQAKEHYLTKIHEIKNPLGNAIFNFYQTNPSEKCKSDPGYIQCLN